MNLNGDLANVGILSIFFTCSCSLFTLFKTLSCSPKLYTNFHRLF